MYIRMSSKNQNIQVIVEGITDIFAKLLQQVSGDSSKVKVSEVMKALDVTDIKYELETLITENMPKKAPSKEKKTKDPNAPKRPKSSYLFFCDEMRAQIKSDNPDFKAVEVTKELGRLWKELGEEDKKPYEKKAKKAKKNYDSQMESYVRPSEEELQALADAKPKRARKGSKEGKEKKESKKKDPNAPKRPSSAFIYFCKDMRQEAKDRVLEDNPAAKPSEVTKELGRMWKEDYADESDRKKWMKMAKKDKARYESEMEAYQPMTDEDQAPKAKRGPSKKAKKDDKEDRIEEVEDDEPKSPKGKKRGSKNEINIESLKANNPITEEDLFGDADE
jgi:hypothetical protein